MKLHPCSGVSVCLANDVIALETNWYISQAAALLYIFLILVESNQVGPACLY